LREGGRQPPNRLGAHQGDVRRVDEKRPAGRWQGLNPGRHRGKHAPAVICIFNAAHRLRGQDPLDFVGAVPRHDDQIFDAGRAQGLHHDFDGAAVPQRQKRFETFHAAGLSARQDDGCNGGILFQGVSPARTAMSAATMLTAISAGVSAPMARPTGE
jgi:hypothetical protein